MITTDFVPGSPCWLDLGAPDVEAAADFYGAVFGWRTESFDPENSYLLFRLDGKIVGAVGALTEADAKSAWMIYFHTTDADITVKAVEQAGGTVRVPASEVPSNVGRFAQLTDPQGAQFALWEPGEHKGIELADAPGSLGWTELYTSDSAAAQQFYGNVFGWTTQDVPLPGGGGTYTLITPADSGDERMHGGIMGMPDMFTGDQKPYWHPVFGTADCDATVARITEKGGAVSMGPEDAEGVGRLAVATDPAGAEFVVLTPAEGS
ncbi:VOC family protein [Streptomyces sp. NA04227]|uniref:VOC family protein n=1 Tax=Streptomyces sp. NA04227 TaxID=2742136 RepID=UPI0015928510|nr:VOC family protein [Streptomyces sp. NA04227]QKW08504.1 VOC family protein [Streptomyces sp. NA04227]